jgi:pimeloyl-ACP methyl ester carboxylesterase
MKTLGGWQFWSDVRFFRESRIQRHVYTGHFRLIDPKNHRLAFGSLETCLAKLAKIKQSENLAPMSGKAIIVVHGILRTSGTFAKMCPALRKAGYTVVEFEYPSTRLGIVDAAGDLRQVIESLEGIQEINFVVHSMGGLVVRAYLKEHRDPRIKRMVMLAVPNQGAEMANLLRKSHVVRFLLGPAVRQLVTDRNGLIPTLPIPDFEFAIVAGARGHKSGFNPLIPGDDDILVTVASAQLPGAADSMTVRAFHRFIPGNAEAIDATIRFLQTGSLRQDGTCHPIPREIATRQPHVATQPASASGRQ